MSILNELRYLSGLNEKQKIGSDGQAKGKDPMPKMSKPSQSGEQPHPLKDKLVGEDDTQKMTAAISALDLDSDDPYMLIANGLEKSVKGEVLSMRERKALRPYVGLFTKLLTTPQFRSNIIAMNKILKDK